MSLMEAITPSHPGHFFAVIDGWEIECCGEPLVVGELLEADLVDFHQRPHQELFRPLDLYWTRHGDEPVRRVRARVVNLWAVRWDLREVGPRSYAEVVGRGQAVSVPELVVDHGMMPSAWVLELDVLEELGTSVDGLRGPASRR